MPDILEPYMSNSNPTLEHHGILGMRWGHRKDETSKLTDNYSTEQFNRDKIIYGNGGAKRINKSISNGYNVSTARSKEKTHRDHVISKNKYFRQGGKVAVGVGTAVGSYAALSAVGKFADSRSGRLLIYRILGLNKENDMHKVVVSLNKMDNAIQIINDPAIKGIIATGAATTASLLGGDIAVSAHHVKVLENGKVTSKSK